MVETVSLAACAFDGLLCLTLLFVAWRLIAAEDLFRAIMLFFAFGLLVSVAWVRLGAVDVALAEATIGAGLTGALFLAALSRLRKGEAPGAARPGREGPSRPARPEDPGRP